MKKYIMALDAGTTSNRCILFDHQGNIVSMAQKEFRQFFPNPGWVEHDANEIWSSQLGVAVEAMNMINAKASDKLFTALTRSCHSGYTITMFPIYINTAIFKTYIFSMNQRHKCLYFTVIRMRGIYIKSRPSLRW